jgi:uncharacterized RDD family membrane protein YckC
MRCPKCQYISFDDGIRCRNCGYDFSLDEPEPPLDLPMRGAESPGPLDDFDLAESATASAPPVPSRRHTPGGGFELPLFTDDDAPLVTPPAVPRAPLAVRRSAPATPRTPFEEPPPRPDTPAIRRRGGQSPPPAPSEPAAAESSTAPPPLRLLGAAIDLAIVLAIDLAVLWLTLRVSELTFADLAALPVVPLAAFLLLLNGGYAVLFTAAGGQTIGKMLAGTRVIPGDADTPAARVPFATAAAREAACLLSLVPVGLGFFLAFVRADGRALHDTLADTRVVRA